MNFKKIFLGLCLGLLVLPATFSVGAAGSLQDDMLVG